jgi:hypothetical protein
LTGAFLFNRSVVAQGFEALAGHPFEEYRHAAELFRQGDREQAVFLFYRGQLRARIHLAARPELPRDGDPALFASLSEAVGRPINEWAFGDIPALAGILDRVLAWHAANDDPFTPKSRFGAAHAEVRRGLAGLRRQIVAEQESIRAQRRANGLANRS